MIFAGDNQTEDDALVFATESKPEPPSEQAARTAAPRKYKLLIVDDEKDIHVMTRLVLSDYHFGDATLDFYSAYSAKEGRKLIKEHPDAACILLDVVMEEKDSGLKLTRFIREEENNHKLRIILRTGQPGKAPENDVIMNYDINDYKEKTELTTQKLFTTITTALRSYSHLIDLAEKTRQIAEKNDQLNDEIARRIVAESNLTKYNRSLEKMIENKSTRLKIALKALRKKENELQQANLMAQVGGVSSASLDSLDQAGDHLKKNMATMNSYRADMTSLLEKYEILQDIIDTLKGESGSLSTSADTAIEEINQFKKEAHIEDMLNRFPEIIQDSNTGISDISNAVNDIRRFTYISEEAFEKKDINQILRHAVADLEPAFAPSVETQVDLNALPLAAVAPKNMNRALSELIKNSFLSISTRGIVSISTVQDESGIVINIHDTGQGIARQDLDHIFKPYFTKNRPGAKGLGLTFARSVITTHNGTIEAESRPGEGSRFTVVLPVPKS